MAPTAIPTLMAPLETATDWLEYPLITAATVGAWAFLISYSVLAPWWQSKEGRHMFALTLALAALGTVSVLRRLIGEWDYYDITITIIYGAIGWELWRRVWLLFRAQGVVGKTPTRTQEEK